MTINYPLLLDYQGTVFGRGFVAEVSACGRLLATREDDGGWTIAGVNPGAVVAEGDDLQAAHAELREAIKEIVIMFAQEAGGYDGFKAEVQRFFYATNEYTDRDWQDAVKRVRESKERLEDLPAKSADKDVYVAVFKKEMREVTPDDNVTRIESAMVDPQHAEAA